MAAIVADTHAAVWYLLQPERLSTGARTAMRGAIQSGEPIFVASISVVEVTYLVERNRLPALALERLERVLIQEGTGFVAAPLDLAIAQTVRLIDRDELPDMPDRIIAATALRLNLPLVSGIERSG